MKVPSCVALNLLNSANIIRPKKIDQTMLAYLKYDYNLRRSLPVLVPAKTTTRPCFWILRVQENIIIKKYRNLERYTFITNFSTKKVLSFKCKIIKAGITLVRCLKRQNTSSNSGMNQFDKVDYNHNQL
eukprot:SAG11_NODE_9197_length_933_cov_4.008393_1_plen_129_part_00